MPERTPVYVVVYKPLPEFITLPKVPVDVPPDLLNATVMPELTGLLFISLSVALTVTELFDATVGALTVMVELAETGMPGTTCIDTVGVRFTPAASIYKFCEEPACSPVYVAE